MKRALTLLAMLAYAGIAFAQANPFTGPRYVAIPPHSYYPVEHSADQLTQWTYDFTYNGTKYTPVIVGTDATNQHQHHDACVHCPD